MKMSTRLILVLFTISLLPIFAAAQNKGVRPLAADASLAETQTWLIDAITKYASYKSRVSSADVSSVKFDRCSMSISMVRRTAAASQDALGVRTKTHSAKQEISFDFTFVAPDGIELADHIFPEFRVVKIKFRSDANVTPSVLSRDHEMVVKEEAGEAIRDALVHAYKLCMKPG